MKQILYIFSMLITTATYAQQGINYKAILKDNSGNVMSNISIDVEFIIKVGATQATTYEEAHTTTTDANGVFILSIGEGMPSTGFDFNDVDWASDDHFLQVFVDDGNDLLDFGTTAFQKVPYAIQADKATLAENVSGLEVITENSISGWRLIGKDPDNYGDTGINAIDLSTSSISSTLNGATGNTAMASGFNTQASGAYATALGFTTEATQTASTALGDKSKANGNSSLAFGNQSEAIGFASVAGGTSSKATGNSSVALGYNADADAFRSAAFGSYNTGGGNPDSWQATDPIFQVGNGQSINSKSNALSILKDGTLTAPSFDISEIIDDKALITKEYFEANQPSIPEAPSGLEQITENDGSQDNTGWRLKGVNSSGMHGPIGRNAVDFSTENITFSNSGATGHHSFAMGKRIRSYGDFSFATGHISFARGYHSISMGSNNDVEGDLASGIGADLEVDSYGSFVIGRYNLGGGDPTTWVDFDPLFEVANGSGDSDRSNALTILKNGQHIIKSASTGLTINSGSTGIEIEAPSNNGISINNSNQLGLFINNSGTDGINILLPDDNGIVITSAGQSGVFVNSANTYGGFFKGDTSGVFVESSIAINPDIILGGTSDTATGDDGIIASDPRFSGSDIVLKSNDNVFIDLEESNDSGTSYFYVRDGANNTRFRVDENGDALLSGTLTQNSDIRLKTNIEDLNYGLKEVLQLQPKAYNWKDQEQNKKSLGLIAQEVQSIINEIVNEQDDTEKTLGVSYTELIPVLINAIKEQQQIIDSERTINRKNKELILGLLVRVEALENQKVN